MKEKLEKRFKEINDEYTKQAKEVLNIEKTLEAAKARVNSLGGQLAELQYIYEEMFKEVSPETEEKNVTKPSKK